MPGTWTVAPVGFVMGKKFLKKSPSKQFHFILDMAKRIYF